MLMYLALTDDGTVIGQFSERDTASKYCNENNLRCMPFHYTSERDTPLPRCGDKYTAANTEIKK